jgi:hypothetical protein
MSPSSSFKYIYMKIYVSPEKTNPITTEKMKVPPLTSVSDSLILIACTKEKANK